MHLATTDSTAPTAVLGSPTPASPRLDRPLDPHPLTSAGIALLDALAPHLAGPVTTPESRRAVTVLTAAADPARADRLRPREGEPGPLVGRLAVWALHRVDDDVVAVARLALG